jgi:transcriptional regulator with PAS, ATPase and Fis domain
MFLLNSRKPNIHLYQKRSTSADGSQGSLKDVQERAEREAVRYAFESSGYNKAQAANMLGIHRTLQYKKMKKYHLSLNRN